MPACFFWFDRFFSASHSKRTLLYITYNTLVDARVSGNIMTRNSMPRKKIDFDTVRKLASALPDVEDASAYGAPAIKVRGKLLTCIPTNKSAEPDSLAVRIGIDQRAELVATAPEVYYFTDHYANYPM